MASETRTVRATLGASKSAARMSSSGDASGDSTPRIASTIVRSSRAKTRRAAISGKHAPVD
jgi:hypothetical protein